MTPLLLVGDVGGTKSDLAVVSVGTSASSETARKGTNEELNADSSSWTSTSAEPYYLEQLGSAKFSMPKGIFDDDAPWLFVVYDQSRKAHRKDRLVNMKLAASNFFSRVNVSLK